MLFIRQMKNDKLEVGDVIYNTQFTSVLLVVEYTDDPKYVIVFHLDGSFLFDRVHGAGYRSLSSWNDNCNPTRWKLM